MQCVHVCIARNMSAEWACDGAFSKRTPSEQSRARTFVAAGVVVQALPKQVLPGVERAS